MAASRSSMLTAVPDACDHAETGSGSQDVNCRIVAWMFRADASHGVPAAPRPGASAVRLATSATATRLSSRASADHRRRLCCLTSGHRSEAVAIRADSAR